MSIVSNHYPELLDQHPDEPLPLARRNPAAEARLSAHVAHAPRCSLWPAGRNTHLDEEEEHEEPAVSFAG